VFKGLKNFRNFVWTEFSFPCSRGIVTEISVRRF